MLVIGNCGEERNLMQIVIRRVLVFALVVTAVLMLTATAQARATVPRATLPSFFVDEEGTFYPMTCRETQVINKQRRKETFHCTFDGPTPAPGVHSTATGASWASDFDGAEATRTHWTITPTGRVNGWAVY
jgi:hypothetical protein